ncbi:MAG: hypothetical protein HUU37_06200 [Bdellovibrionales bacterium]|nr:hypothetical protein [Bdellovibrionales bacterium]
MRSLILLAMVIGGTAKASNDGAVKACLASLYAEQKAVESKTGSFTGDLKVLSRALDANCGGMKVSLESAAKESFLISVSHGRAKSTVDQTKTIVMVK